MTALHALLIVLSKWGEPVQSNPRNALKQIFYG